MTYTFVGVVPISVEGYYLKTYPRFLATTQELPEEFPFKLDVNSGNPIGMSLSISFIENVHVLT